MPKISIITTTYKHEKFIAAMIDSVLSQSFTDWELLIGDDNSPDNTYCIIQEYTKKDPRIKSWKQEKNTGIVGNMNFILSKVNTESEYVTFLEGDDMYSPENLMEKFRIFRKYDNIDFFWSDWHKMDAEDNITPRKTHRTE